MIAATCSPLQHKLDIAGGIAAGRAGRSGHHRRQDQLCDRCRRRRRSAEPQKMDTPAAGAGAAARTRRCRRSSPRPSRPMPEIRRSPRKSPKPTEKPRQPPKKTRSSRPGFQRPAQQADRAGQAGEDAPRPGRASSRASARGTLMTAGPGRCAAAARSSTAGARRWARPTPSDLVVDFDLFLNPDGTVAQPPQLTGNSRMRPADPYTRAAAEAASRAIYQCAALQAAAGPL